MQRFRGLEDMVAQLRAPSGRRWYNGSIGGVATAKKLIILEGNQLGEDIIEACECLKR
jgi:hypothetical protein